MGSERLFHTYLSTIAIIDVIFNVLAVRETDFSVEGNERCRIHEARLAPLVAHLLRAAAQLGGP